MKKKQTKKDIKRKKDEEKFYEFVNSFAEMHFNTVINQENQTPYKTFLEGFIAGYYAKSTDLA